MTSYSARTVDEVQAAIAAGKTIHILTPEIDGSRLFEDHFTFVRSEETGRRVKLGSGVYGSVYTAKAVSHSSKVASDPFSDAEGSDVSAQVEEEQLYAVKEIDKLHALNSVKTETGFQRCVRSMRTEVQVLRELRSREGSGKEFVLGLVDVFECATHIRIVTEHCSGGDLLSKPEGGRLTESQVRRQAWQVTRALRFMHDDCSAVHCDLKPQNVMFKDKTRQSLRVIDFGMARILESGALLSDPCGSAYYTAPEIINTRHRKAAYSHPCDIWSLGNLVFVLLCRYPAFAVDASKYEDNRKVRRAIYRKILGGFHPIVYEARTAGYGPWFVDTIPLSPQAQDWVGNCLITEPERRWTAAQLLEHPWFAPIRRTIAPIRVMKLFSPIIQSSDTTPACDTDTFAWSSATDASHQEGLALALPLSPEAVAKPDESGGERNSAVSTDLSPPMSVPRLASPSPGASTATATALGSGGGSGSGGPESSELATQSYQEIWAALGRFRWKEWDLREAVGVVCESVVRRHIPALFDCAEEIFDDMRTTAQTLRSAREEPSECESTRSLSMSHSISPRPSASLTPKSVISAASTTSTVTTAKSGKFGSTHSGGTGVGAGGAGGGSSSSSSSTIAATLSSTTVVKVDFAAFCVRMRLMRKRVSVEKLRKVWAQLTQPRLEEQCMRVADESPMKGFDRRSHIELRDLKNVIIQDYLKRNDGVVFECFQSLIDDIAADKLMSVESQITLEDASPFGSSRSRGSSVSSTTSSIQSRGKSKSRKKSKFQRKVKARRKRTMDEDVRSKYHTSDGLAERRAVIAEGARPHHPPPSSHVAHSDPYPHPLPIAQRIEAKDQSTQMPNSSVESSDFFGYTASETDTDVEEPEVPSHEQPASDLAAKLRSLAVKFKFPPPTMMSTAVDLSRADSTNMSVGSRTSSSASVISMAASSISDSEATSPSFSRSTSLSTSISQSASQQRSGWIERHRAASSKKKSQRTKKTIRSSKARAGGGGKGTITTTTTTITTTVKSVRKTAKRKRAASKPRLRVKHQSGSLIRNPYRAPALKSKSSLPLSFVPVHSGSAGLSTGSPFMSPLSPATSVVSTPPPRPLDSDDKTDSPVFSSVLSGFGHGLVCLDVKCMLHVYAERCRVLKYWHWKEEWVSLLSVHIVRQLMNEDLISDAQFIALFH